ncbi:phosphomannomutase/phosphoglucomutase [Candidatus Woesearchaeota archaeon]|nr:phosphomannomutase/phosphoglucomutase [Candidatus Woesearchaeota archaeon]MBL7050916.1 phosphomannomutase/phosphoglucomutase [Candidatus Woesearchaeota archaeon]
MGIFKAYDIRGVYPKELNEKIMEKIGRAFADFIKGKNIAVGYDMRVSGPKLFDAFVKGVTLQGKNVINFGLTSTPMAYFASAHLGADGMAMITASHNPKEYNGVKFTREEAIPISGDTGIMEIKDKVDKEEFKKVTKIGKVTEKDVKEEYKKHLLSFVKGIKELKVVVDCANGMGAQDFSLIQKELLVDVVPLYFEIDGTFPNHDANPMKKGVLEVLKKRVIAEKAELGIAFDGDADRVFFIDNEGELVPSDFITALISEEILKHKSNSLVLYDLRSSWIVPEMIEKFGGRSLRCRVGHSFIKQKMREDSAVFAGELSGHFYFKDNFFTDSGIITAIWVMNLLSAKNIPFSELIRPLKKYFNSGEINSEVGDKEAKMKELAESYKKGRVSWLDGVRVDFDDWWFNVRPSNTEPLLRLNLEAKTLILLKEKKEELLKIIRS